MNDERTPTPKLHPGDCAGCGAPYPHCDCGRDEEWAREAEADAREGQYTAWELLG